VCSAGTHIRLTHGYEFFLMVGRNIEPDGDIDMRQIPGGLYAVLQFKNLENIGNAWEHLWNWIRENKYEYIGNQIHFIKNLNRIFIFCDLFSAGFLCFLYLSFNPLNINIFNRYFHDGQNP
jgi:hypothetical protein